MLKNGRKFKLHVAVSNSNRGMLYIHKVCYISNKTVSPGYTATSENRSSPVLCET